MYEYFPFENGLVVSVGFPFVLNIILIMRHAENQTKIDVIMLLPYNTRSAVHVRLLVYSYTTKSLN